MPGVALEDSVQFRAVAYTTTDRVVRATISWSATEGSVWGGGETDGFHHGWYHAGPGCGDRAVIATAQPLPASATLTGRVPTGNLQFAAHGGAASFLDGKVDYVRCFSVARADHADWRLRWPAPKVAYCLYDYGFNQDSLGNIRDRSLYENHAVVTSAPQ